MNVWTPVCHKSNLTEPNSFVWLPRIAAFDKPVVVSNFDGYARAWDNRCPHRGAFILPDQPSGKAPPICAYHGRCAKFGDVNALAAGCIDTPWLWVSEGDLSLAYSRRPSIWLLEKAPLQMILHSWIRNVMDCRWTVAVENALDFEHAAHVHSTSLARLKLEQLPGGAGLSLFPDGSSLEVFSSDRAKAFDSLSLIMSDAGFMGGFDPHMDYAHAHVFPYTCVSSTRGWTYSMQHYLPRSDGRTDFIHKLYTLPVSGAAARAYFQSVADVNRAVFAEDAAICARTPPFHDGKLEAHEDRIAHFRMAFESYEELW